MPAPRVHVLVFITGYYATCRAMPRTLFSVYSTPLCARYSMGHSPKIAMHPALAVLSAQGSKQKALTGHTREYAAVTACLLQEVQRAPLRMGRTELPGSGGTEEVTVRTKPENRGKLILEKCAAGGGNNSA